MTHKFLFDAIDRTLRDIMENEKPFGDKVFVMGGDFRQTLPIVKRGSRSQVLLSSMRSSNIWSKTKVLSLNFNMRIWKNVVLLDQIAKEEARSFSTLLLDIGSGLMPETKN